MSGFREEERIFCERLKRLRGDEKQNTVADAIGTTAQSLGRYEKGERIPDIFIASRLADYFGVSCDYLLGRSDLKSPNKDDKYVHIHTGLTDGSLITIQQAKNEQEAGGAPALDALNALLSDDDFAGVVNDLANIKALQAAFEPTSDDTTLIAFERDKFALEISVIRHFENMRRRMIETLAGVDYE